MTVCKFQQTSRQVKDKKGCILTRKDDQLKQLTPLLPVTGHDKALEFVPLLVSSSLTKIGIIYTQLLQEENIFRVIPRSE